MWVSWLHGDTVPDERGALSLLHGEEAACVYGCVNVITGDYFDRECDLVIPGSEPLELSRFYYSSQTHSPDPWRAWRFNHDLFIATHENKEGLLPIFYSPFGVKIPFRESEGRFYLDPKIFDKGVKNGSFLKSLSLDLTEQRRYLLKEGGKTYLFHKLSWSAPSLLECVTFAHRYHIRYAYDAKNIPQYIASFNKNEEIFGEIGILYSGIREGQVLLQAKGTGQKKVSYSLNRVDSGKGKKWILNSVERTYAPSVAYDYDPSYEKIIRKRYPEGRFLEIDYTANSGKVKEIRSPEGALFRFAYFNKKKLESFQLNGWTEVYDSRNHLKKYHWGPDERLTKIESYCGKDNASLYSSEKFTWGHPCTFDAGRLLSRSLVDADKKIQYFKNFTYDAGGNLVAEDLHGHLTGEGGTQCLFVGREYSKDGRQLILFENHPQHDHNTLYEYYPGTGLLKARFIIEGSSIKMREIFDYDENGAKTLEILDDGSSRDSDSLLDVTERRVKRFQNSISFPRGLPLLIEEHLPGGIRITFNEYNEEGRLAKQRVVEGSKEACYEWEYNPAGQVIVEKTPQETIERGYDSNGNKIFEKRLGWVRLYTYDLMNRLIQEELIGDEGLRLKEEYRYDLSGNKTSHTDIYGKQTRWVYDEFGRQIKTIYPSVLDENEQIAHPIVEKTYNVLGHVTSVTDPLQRTTTIESTLLGKPYLITYPDKSQERFTYSIKGNLLKKVEKDGSYTLFHYDFLSRPIEERSYSKEGELQCTVERHYSALPPLSLNPKPDSDEGGTYRTNAHGDPTLFKDAEGKITRYFYTYFPDNVTEILYPSGYSLRITRDAMRRIIREEVLHPDRHLLQRYEYRYDLAGNLKSCTDNHGHTTHYEGEKGCKP